MNSALLSPVRSYGAIEKLQCNGYHTTIINHGYSLNDFFGGSHFFAPGCCLVLAAEQLALGGPSEENLCKASCEQKQIYKLSEVADVFKRIPDKTVCDVIVKRGYNLMNIIVPT